MSNSKLISIIIPCFNEEMYIEKVIQSILSQTYPQTKIEVIIVDGMSIDNTRMIISTYLSKHKNILLLDNPDQVVPFALNKAIKQATGEVIIRMDAHSDYPNDYVEKLVYWLFKLDADNVGGVWETLPANNTLESKAIALATSHPFGIGNAQYRISDKKSPYKVDTVPFGCYKKKVFNQIGLFDEELIRNQDDEFNGRLIQNGGTIYLIPDLKIKYFARDNFKKMYKMFYQYAYFKPLVNIKLKHPATIRQFVPPAFILFLIFGFFLSFFSKLFLYIYLTILGSYFFANLCIAIILAKNNKKKFLIPLLVKSFTIIHASYGLGFLKGTAVFNILKKNINNNLNKITISR